MNNSIKPNTKEHNAMMNAIYTNIENFNIEKHLPEFNQIIRENKYYKLNILDLIEKMQHFHRFTPESLEHMINVINTNPNTFIGYGPYIKVDGYWKSTNKNKVNSDNSYFEKKIITFTKQIEEQKKYIEILESKIRALQKNAK